MIGVLLTSTCFHEGIDRDTYLHRVEELITGISSLNNHINQPFELIIVDNSPPEYVPTEYILKLYPQITTLFIRSTHNPGKDIGEAVSIRDGVCLSYARGHTWLLKLTGRYLLNGNWRMEESIKELEQKNKFIYVHLIGRRMRDMPWAEGHPFYKDNLHNDKILAGVGTQAFIIKPDYMIDKRVFKKEYMYREIQWVNYEQKVWHAIKELDWAYWPVLPINGFLGNRNSNYSLRDMFKTVDNPIFLTRSDYKNIPSIDIRPLIESSI